MAEVGFSHLILTIHFRDKIRGLDCAFSYQSPLPSECDKCHGPPKHHLLYLSTYTCVILRVLLPSMTIMMRVQLVVTNQIGRLIYVQRTLRGLDPSPLTGGPLVVMTPMDYMRTSLANFNILIPQSQSGACHQFEFMNIPGHECFNCTAPLWY